MNIVLLGLNHKTAPIELRERLAIGPQQLEEATRSLVQAPGVLEAARRSVRPPRAGRPRPTRR